jgi:hypothetical protein
MKMRIKIFVKYFGLIFVISLTALFWTTGCGIFFPVPQWHPFTSHSDPLKGWNFCWSQDPSKLDKAIQDDYQDYIQKLPPEEKKFASYEHDFEDGTGQHAVKIVILLDGTEWSHVLIYEKDNKRIKTIKYISGRYSS